ncbi:MAG: hypothetical protein IPL41_03040 [Micropruina sp.]|nr:hypothetical protein [Micropruina sp.]
MTEASPRPLTLRSYRFATAFTLGAVLLGSAVCATESGQACPTWPGCFPGQVTPDELHSAIEFTHRVVAFGSLVTLGWASWQGRHLSDRRLRWFPVVALVAAIASGAFGMMIVLFSLPLALGVLDVAAAQVALCLITWATVRLRRPGRTGRVGWLAWTATAAVIAMHLLGIVVAGSGSLVRCLGWPVWRIVATDGSPLLQWTRLALGLVAGVLLVLVVLRAWSQERLRVVAGALAAAWIIELLLGQLIVAQFTGEEARHLGLAGTYSMLAGLIVWLLALVASRADAVEPMSPVVHPYDHAGRGQAI